ncbi:lipocalin family protein [Capnocytophaga leadbetteri]|uniref:lipocalin family protein n=1 Tax=Capnocytophaga leadbetteri TaxID=327575 RepID=UPI0028E499D3|nr:lipocalin family protein [Capnocytophaga leadbetteri]
MEKLFSQIVPAEVFNCIKKMNYIFKGDRWILNEYNYKNDEKTCKYNSASFLYVVKGSTICFVINDKALRALDVINLNESELVFKYNDEFKRIMRLQMQEQNSLELSGYTIDDILNVTITYRR